MSMPSHVSKVNELTDAARTLSRPPEQTPNLFLTGRTFKGFLTQSPFSI
jgi:hypothetical protein